LLDPHDAMTADSAVRNAIHGNFFTGTACLL
jgi:hypothetical protein